MRLAASVEYDGSAYHGWQRQSHAASVQACVESALSRVAAQPVTVVCAGRTDTGVHATGQIVSFETTARRDPRAWVLGGNSNLPTDISIRWVQAVDDSFHARFSARSRRYRYVIYRRLSRSSLLRKRALWCHYALDVEAMRAASAHLLGEHDFSSFRSGACQARHAIRQLYQLSVSGDGEFVYVDVHANGFLHNMVRIMVGVLLAIGRGIQPTDWTRTLLLARDRTISGVTAAPHGLYFVGADYPSAYELPTTRWYPRF